MIMVALVVGWLAGLACAALAGYVAARQDEQHGSES